ncbi:hypothetical protein ACFL6D_04440 [Spirochaetota bacterium]
MEGYEKILILKDEVESRLMESMLKERKIPYVVRSYHDPSLDGLFQVQKGWGYIEAPPEYKDEINTIYSDLIEREEGPEKEQDGE